MAGQGILEDWYRAGLRAVDPGERIRALLAVDGDHLRIGEMVIPFPPAGIRLLAAGKAALPMARAALDLLGERVTSALAVTKHGAAGAPSGCRVRRAGHPLPDADGLGAADELLDLAADAGAAELVLWLCSGGASAMLPAPVPGLSLEDLRSLNAALVGGGAAIDEINCVRKHCSRLKGGGLARAARPASLIGLLVSDVPGDDPAVIGSGPAAPDGSSFADALAVLERHRLRGAVPPAVVAHLERGRAGALPETPWPGDPVFARVHQEVIANNGRAVRAVSAAARAAGRRVVACELSGPAAAAGSAFARRLLELGSEPVCLVGGGETTVSLGPAPGRGGRNQEFALAAAAALRGRAGPRLLAAGTDGEDGPTDAAGARVDGALWDRAIDLGHDPAEHLSRHDTYPLLAACGALFKPGPTGTNVMDLAIGVNG